MRKTERRYNRNKAFEIEEINTSNPSEFWKHINSLGPRKSTRIPMEVYSDSSDVDSCKVSDPDVVLRTWKGEFQSLYNIPESEHDNFDADFYNGIMAALPEIKYDEMYNTNYDTYGYNQPFTHNELDKICTKLKLQKAVGPDMIPNEVLKHPNLRSLLLDFINMCFVHNIIPSVWRKAVIAPIPKSSTKDPCVPLNYRGISLLSCVYKIYSSLLNLRITAHCENNDLLVDEQNGFRSKRSCEDHIFVLSSIIRNRKLCGKDTFCAYIDFRKAFDWVSRDLLLYKMSTSFNIHGRLFNSISTIYSSSNSQIRLNGMLTESFNVTSGVRQGDILSPILFSMYLNDLATGIKDLNCGIDISGINVPILLYADDIVLIAPDEKSLQRMLKFIYKWCMKWRMAVNTDKTKIVHFRKSNITVTKHPFSLGPIPLETVSCYKYLGVMFDEFLTFEQNANLLADAGSRALGAIRTKLKYLKECGYNSFNTLFRSGVLSITDYAAGVWGTKVFSKIEQVLYKGARYYLGVHRFAPTDALLGEMGWMSARNRHNELILKLWNRLCKLPNDRLTKQVFQWDLLHCNRRGAWSYNAKHLIHDMGCPELFMNTSPCNMTHVKTVLKDSESTDWDIRRYKSDKLRYFNLYKYDMEPEEYVMWNVSKHKRSLFAQFRCGILPLQIEVGRFKNIQLRDRICPVCNQAVEDEVHFLCECSKYSDYRNTLFYAASLQCNVFMYLDALDQFVYLMSNMQKEVMNFLMSAVSRRTNCISVCYNDISG